jgi:hypothetical protein
MDASSTPGVVAVDAALQPHAIDIAPPKPAAAPTPIHRRMPLWLRTAIVAGLIAVAVWLFFYGVTMRRNVWHRTQEIRYLGDVSNGFGWGQVANDVGLLNVYDLFYQRQLFSYPNELDYTPLRLTIVYFWARWARSTEPFTRFRSWQNDFDLTWPMLRMNLIAEAASAFLVFWLIRHWIIRMDDARRSPLVAPTAFRGVARGMIGACLLWFNPCVIWDSHGFPQWDVWNLPFFLAAALLASTDWWFTAGVCVVVGAFLKGQILLVAPLFLLWPLFAGRFVAPLRFVAGFVFGGAMLALPWMHVSSAGMIWYLGTLLSLGLIVPYVLRIDLRWQILVALALAATLLVWPWTASATTMLKLAAPAIIVAVALARFLPVRLTPPLYALAVGLFIFMEMPLYGGSSAWFRQGFQFGTEKLMWMATQDTYNIPYLLSTTFRWGNNPYTPVDVPLLGMTPIRDLMLYIYAGCLVLCAAGTAISDRRSDAKILAAFAAPWLCWFVLLTQLNNRYMIWAAGLSGLMAGVGLGMSLLGIIVSIIGWCGIAQIMCWSGGDPYLASWTRPVTPHLAWALMLAAAIYLYVALVPRRLPRIKKPAAAS